MRQNHDPFASSEVEMPIGLAPRRGVSPLRSTRPGRGGSVRGSPMHELAFPLLAGLIVLALAFDFLNGLHDAANRMATVVATRMLPPVPTALFRAFFHFH